MSCLVLFGVGSFGAGSFGAGTAQAEPSTTRPALHVADTGGELSVTLTGWPDGQPVSVTVCGALAQHGSADCAVASGTLLAPDAGGRAEGSLAAAAPPAACPCVVRARALTGSLTVAVAAPARIVGLAPPAQPTGAAAAEPDSAIVSAPETTPAPGLTVGRYLALLAAGVAVILIVGLVVLARARRRREPTSAVPSAVPSAAPGARRTPLSDLLLLRLPALGCVLASLAMLCALGYRVVDAGAQAAAGQRRLAAELARDWSGAPAGSAPAGPPAAGSAPAAPASAGQVRQSQLGAEQAPADGQPFGLLRAPAWGADYQVGLVQGVSQDDLAIGPGHYPDSAMPGDVGNFALAGHRGPPGEPFNDIDKLVDGDELVVETAQSVYVYRVTGHAIVSPHEVDVIAPVPRQPGQRPSQAVMTLTACHPKWSSAQRWVTWAVLVSSTPKASGQ